ncbi:MAG: hypothetical protein GY813_14575 [Halieaceae bacterium]|nr:hypothetical protein [Halieaceae bacterium]
MGTINSANDAQSSGPIPADRVHNQAPKPMKNGEKSAKKLECFPPQVSNAKNGKELPKQKALQELFDGLFVV